MSLLGFDYGTRRCWIDDLGPQSHPGSYELCSVHVGRFRPPRGWEVDDRRRAPDALFRELSSGDLSALETEESEAAPSLLEGLPAAAEVGGRTSKGPSKRRGRS